MRETADPPSQRRVGSFRNARTLFHTRGIPIRVDLSWLLIAGLVLFFFYSRMAERLDSAPSVVGLAAVAAALLFFASLLAHELGHAYTSLDRDIPVLGITLFLLGGVTESTREAASAKDEFIIVGIGPFISLVLAAVFGLAYTAVEPHQPYAIVAGYLAWTNLMLGVFNLVPGYPLDGGRLLRSILWWVTRRPHQATRWAARVGQVFALLLGAFGVWTLTSPRTGGLGGLWEILIAVFLFKGAADAHAQARLRERLAALTARDVMGSVPSPLDPESTLDEAIGRVQTRPSLLWPVGSPVRGAVSLDDIDAVPSHEWPRTTVHEVCHDAEHVTIDADAPMDQILERLVRAPRQMLIVVEHGAPVGLLTPSLVTEPARSGRR